MNGNILVFGGTTEGRILAERLAERRIGVTVSVATAYGRELLPQENRYLHIISGRINAEGIERLLQQSPCACVVDATHPYAAEVTKNIRQAAHNTATPYYRIIRQTMAEKNGVIIADSIETAALWLNQTEGRVLLTTGSKNLVPFTAVAGFPERFYVRVLPTVEAVESCHTLGFAKSHIIAMQGPFNRELNEAILKQFQIQILVTKEGGRPGGFQEKIEAAACLGLQAVVVGRPEEEGYSLDELLQKLLGKFAEE